MSADLIVFGEDWGGHPSSTQHLMKRLRQGRRLLWVNSLGMRRPRLMVRDLRRIATKLRAACARPSRHATASDHGFAVLAPLSLPLPGLALADRINRSVIGRMIRRAAEPLALRDPVVWTSLPTASPLIGRLGERAAVYYCADDYGALPGVDADAMRRHEDSLARNAALILAASPVLAARFPAAKTVLLPHGADVDHFARPCAKASELGSRPTAGFYGSIAAWIDLDLIADTARRLPGWDFVLIGDVQTDVRVLAPLSNVKLLGARPHDRLPGFAQHWTASLLPFRDTPQIRACNPLKLREYLAAGRPVIGTAFPALDDYRDVVTTVADGAGLAAALRAAALEGDRRVEDRRDRVAHETWEARAREAAALIDAL